MYFWVWTHSRLHQLLMALVRSDFEKGSPAEMEAVLKKETLKSTMSVSGKDLINWIKK